MKIIIPGGSGQIGTLLARSFHGDRHEVVVLSRKPTRSPWHVVPWDAVTLSEWSKELEGADAVINLAGRSVNCRYNLANRREIMDSRVRSTRIIGRAIANSAHPPKVWLQSSTATIYSHRYDAPNNEATGILGGTEPNAPSTWKFSIEVARAWETAANEATAPNTRKVMMRSAMVMSPDRGGIFDVMLGLVRNGLGGTAGNGRQYLSWIHHADFVRAVRWLIGREDLSGPVNVASPNPLPNAEFMREFRGAWGQRFGLPSTRWMLALGAFAMRTETELVLKSRRVIPTRLLESGFEFQYPHWSGAVADLCRQWSAARSGRTA